jgi:hypothetical protein
MPATVTLHNLLEPEGLVRHFQENPPRDFEVLHLDSGVPAFSTAFDLLTTVEPSIRTWIHRLPAFARWHPLLEPESGFIGTTVSEYALFPFDADAKELADSLTALARRYPLVIVKDLPAEATLVGERALAFSNQLITQCLDAGFVMVEGQALAYVPITFASIEEFLSSRSESRRKNIRRKLKSRTSLQIESIPTGDPRFRDPSLWKRCTRST